MKPGKWNGKKKAAGGFQKPAFKPRPVRRGQLIAPFGVGSMNDFRNDEALMCAGLDEWFRSPPEETLRITEERLAARLNCSFFIKPPDFSESEGGPKYKIPHVRFPLWHYCPRCFRMKKTTLFGGQPVCTEQTCSKSKHGRRMIPVRIVAVCENGHIEDFPFKRWIGCTCASEYDSRMFFKAGRSAASLAGIKIECEACDRRRSLAGAFEEGALGKIDVQCCAAQPWLGRETGVHSCSAGLQTLQRGGSNIYFPAVQSSIYIPPAHSSETDEIRRVLDEPVMWSALTSGLEDGKIIKMAAEIVARMGQVDATALAAAAQARLDSSGTPNVATTEEDFRRQEYEVLRAGVSNPTDELFVERLDGDQYDWLGHFFKRVGLVRKLRETRVLTGFSRLVPKTDRGDPAVQRLSIDGSINWLPAMEVRGEGIFIEIDSDAIDSWIERSKAPGRLGSLLTEFNNRRLIRSLSARNIDARFMMIHTLAHALIKELTFSCGYGSAALRERLYCNLEDPNQPMNGFLIYTASGDSEGTLGGLVSEARPGRLQRLVEDALRRSQWCSNDPICMESPGDGAMTSNLAACHGCVLLPETSCEEGNRLLDRGLLVGQVRRPDLGFFHGAPIT
ncbi:DUF1998 domain-containing protein [Tardiphaga robiniae]|uniref:DUF1998 domain-containing protein n=1 Tax=Tardiphaga robiniae TaxID=943830 RepID=UPI001586A881|nr:DUF1998 domain-containing protein [Tardiphaga robiniae]NUU41848.1 DUF1998 domain-containing protein [Tardiphaga robiniae]